MHSSQQSPSPQRGSWDSKSSNLEKQVVLCEDVLGATALRDSDSPEQQLLGGHGVVEDVDSGFVQSSHDRSSFDQGSAHVPRTLSS